MNKGSSMLQSKKYFSLLILLAVIIVTTFISVHQRNNQFKYWIEHKDAFFVGEYPSVTTLDAYLWLRLAKFKIQGLYDGKHKDFLGNYPNTIGTPLDKPPVISSFLATFYKFFDSEGYNHLYVGSIKLINLLASIFIIPLILVCYKLGFTSAGVLGGLIGTFSWAYYPRSYTGRIDTDSLLLFFPFMAILLTLLIPKMKKLQFKIILSLLIGLTLNFYAQWHAVASSFNFIYALLFLLFLFINKQSRREILIIFLSMILTYNPINFINGIYSVIGFLKSSYFSGILHADPLKNIIPLPDIITTITETQKRDPNEVIQMVYGLKPLFLLGLLGFIGLVGYRWREAFLMLPLFGLGILAFKGSNRFALFLAPFIGIGIGFIIEFIIDSLFSWLKDIKLVKLLEQFNITFIPSIIIVFIIFMTTKNATAYNVIHGPSVDIPTVQSFIELKKILPKHSAVFTWWDYGYCLEEIPEFRVYHDGGRHGGLDTFLVAKGFTLDNQTKLYNLLSIWEKSGKSEEIVVDTQEKDKQNLMSKLFSESLTGDEFLQKILNYTKTGVTYNTYMLYTGDMISKYGAISTLGNWDFNNRKSSPDFYSYLNCSAIKDNNLICSGMKIDMTNGIINFDNGGKSSLKKCIYTDKGNIVSETTYNNENGIYLQILMKDKKIFKIMLCNNSLFNSNFNQQFILGNIDKNLYQEVYNNFPVARAFKILNRESK